MGRRVSWVPALAAAAALLVGTSGCDTNPTPGPLTSGRLTAGTLPSDPAPSAGRLWQSTPPTAPAMPVAAQGTGPRAAKAFVRHYFEVINYAARTGETEQLTQLSATTCASCNAIRRNIESTYREGGYIRSQGWRVTVLSSVPAQPRQRPIFDVGLIQSPETVVIKSGAKPKHYPGGKRPMTMYLDQTPSGWRVTRLDLVAS